MEQLGTVQGKEPKAMELIVEQLTTVLSDAQGISMDFSQKAEILEQQGITEGKIDNEKQVRREGAIPKLMELINSLKEVNQRNRDTLSHLNRLI